MSESTKKLTCTIPGSLWSALEERMQRTGETLDQVVANSLNEELGLTQHTIFQVSTSGALVKGVYQGFVRMGDIKRHGDFGLGTFDSLDGEGIMLEGHCYRAGSNGTVSEVSENVLTPFWVTTKFQTDRKEDFQNVLHLEDLCDRLSAMRPSDNLMAAIRIDGIFSSIKVRVACKAEAGVDLVSAMAHQHEFSYQNIKGTLIGFYTPEYARTINVPGYHLHFLSSDRICGGHVLNLKATLLSVAVEITSDFHVALPENQAFLLADLTGDPAAQLSKAEGSSR
jgi:acetolactate decarboxylase